MLNELELEPVYKTKEIEVGTCFYVPCMKESISYSRVAAYFDAKALAFYSKGIEGLLVNRGHFRLIISESVSEEDFNAIREGYDIKTSRDSLLLERFDETELTLIDQARLGNLAYLISIGLIDIKLALTKEGIFHDKFGIFEDANGNIVYFRGSNNETGAAIHKNYESFEVTTNWNCGFNESKKIDLAKKTYIDLWNNCEAGVMVIDFTDSVVNKIIKYDKGRVFMEKELLFKNLIEIDYVNNRVECINYSDVDFNLNDFYIMKTLKRFITNISSDRIEFNTMINYIEIKALVGRIEKYCEKKGLAYRISNRLEKYIQNKDLKIGIRAKLGIDIKNQEETIQNGFRSFERIVNRELERKLKPLQMWGAFHICMMTKSANFSVPGAGKTSIVYGAFAFLSSDERQKVDKIVVLGPKSSFLAWKDEFKANFGNKRALACYDIHQDASSKGDRIYHLRYRSKENNLILVNYESTGSLEEVLSEIIDEKTLLVFDEAHRIKGIQKERATSALRVAKQANYKVVLTGTPIPNGYVDIYNMFNILYHDEYEEFFGYSVRDLIKPNEDLINQINDKIFPFYCRATKEDLMIPPPEPDIILNSKMTEDENELFKMIHTKMSDNIFELYVRLIQASTNPMLLLDSIDEKEIMELFPELKEKNKENPIINHSFLEMKQLAKKICKTSKYHTGINLVTSIAKEGKKVIVWAMFVKTLISIENDLRKQGLCVRLIYGDIRLETRESIINEFKNGLVDVIIANPNTMAESVSLHSVCHDAVYFEYSFNLAHMVQSRDRINRLGLQENQYTRYYYLMLDSTSIENRTIDERIYKRLKEKEQIMLDAIEGNTLRNVQFDDRDDIISIMNEEMW